MSACPPPWEALTAADVAQRLAALTASSFTATSASLLDVRRSFRRDAVISTGSAALDRLLPDGGVACGAVLEICGPPAAGKSRLALQMAAAFVAASAAAGRMRARQDDPQPQRAEEEGCGSDDWCLFLVHSDPSSLSARHVHELLAKALATAAASTVRCDDDNDDDAGVSSLLQKVRLVPFSTPNDLLAFFRFLYRVEYVAAHHHMHRRRVLVVVDSVARIWEHPTCGATAHARHWMAAELVREVRNAVTVGNGWREAPCERAGDGCGKTHDTFLGNQRPVGSDAGATWGSVTVVFVNGCTSMYHRRSSAAATTSLPAGPLGVPVWCAAASDLRLFVEPLSDADGFLLHGSESDDECGTQQSTRGARATMKVRLVKGGGAPGSPFVVV